MTTFGAPSHSRWEREEVRGVVLGTDSLAVRDPAQLVVFWKVPWTAGAHHAPRSPFLHHRPVERRGLERAEHRGFIQLGSRLL
ncbi:MAG: hypothetical protein CL927_20505 [Deltaproteobacteria bacterium]|nr:hypothetical protein [Deltaproteobacteria bacterium]HCH64814.1 hypothetical protein [Deltaproteobacteria bacterium]